jgi:hypothetical protein
MTHTKIIVMSNEEILAQQIVQDIKGKIANRNYNKSLLHKYLIKHLIQIYLQ